MFLHEQVDFSTFAAQLTDAYKARDRAKALKSLGEETAEGAADVMKEVQLIDAVTRYDLPKLATLLGLKVPDRSVKELK